MNELMKNITLSLYVKNQNLFTYLTNILLYVRLFYDYENVQTTQELYENLKNIYATIVEKEYVFNINIIPYNVFVTLTDIKNIKFLFDKKYNYIDIIKDVFKSKRELNIYYKELTDLSIDTEIIDYFYSNIDDIKNYKQIINLFSGTGEFINNMLLKNVDPNNISCYDIDDDANRITKIIIYLQTKINVKHIYKTDVLKDNVDYPKANLIVCELPNIKNIIYANCCEKIKQFKIRGTKCEPLCLQLITNLLDENSVAAIIVRDGFLYNPSQQHVETRKLLIEKFNVTKIIHITSKKLSIMIFDNKNITSKIQFTNLESTYNLLIPKDEIVDKQYSLYHTVYKIDIHNNIMEDSKMIKIDDIVKIHSDIIGTNTNTDVLISYNDFLFDICKITKDTNFDYIFETKNNDLLQQNFLNFYLYDVLRKNLQIIVRGNGKSLDINLIKNMTINIPDIIAQNILINIYNQRAADINNSINQINNFNELKNNIIKSKIANESSCKLSNICEITTELVSQESIRIFKSGNSVGTVELVNKNDNSSSNSFYLNIIDNKYNISCLYHILKYYEKDIITLSNINNTKQLSKSKLENMQIPNIPIEKQIKFLKCDCIDGYIKQRKIYIDNLINRDIIQLYDDI